MTPCPGCKLLPVDIGDFGRHRYVCSRYAARDPATTDQCVGNVGRPSYHGDREAREDWEASIPIWLDLAELRAAETEERGQ